MKGAKGAESRLAASRGDSPAPGDRGTPRWAVAHVPDGMAGAEGLVGEGGEASPPLLQGPGRRIAGARARRASGASSVLSRQSFSSVGSFGAPAALRGGRGGGPPAAPGDRDWAGGVAALALEKVLESLGDPGGDRENLRDLYAAAGVNRAWRVAARSAAVGPAGLTHVGASGFAHPSQLLVPAETCAVSEVRCHVVRQRLGMGVQRYAMWSGEGPHPGSKLLFWGTLRVAGTKSWSRIYLHRQVGREALLTLSSSLAGNRFSVATHAEALQRADTARLAGTTPPAQLESIKYFYNLAQTGHTHSGNGPRKIHVSFRSAGRGEAAGAGAAAQAPCERASSRVLKNKPPRWHPHLQCWCLDFHGRIQMASVKNIQLVEEGSKGEEVLLQFGKADNDVYNLDFNPTRLSALNAFGIALSSFNSHAAIEL